MVCFIGLDRYAESFPPLNPAAHLTPMAYDYKRLCNELLSYLYQCNWPDGKRFYALVERARAALAWPEQEGPTDEELADTYWTAWHEHLDRTNSVLHAAGLRAVLARWGNHPGFPDSSTPQPVLVTERLPGPRDCDSEGRCWWAEPQIEDSHDATWTLCTQEDAEEFLTWGTKYGWLPAYALPLPSYPTSLSS